MTRTDLTGEEWRPLPGWEERYEVSNLGRLYSLKRFGISRSGRILTPTATPSGHLSVSLRRDGYRKESRVHQLVLLAFVGPYPAGTEVRHLNGDPADNRLENLRYDSRRANSLDRALHRDPEQRVPRCRNGHSYTPANTYFLRTRPRQRNCRTCLDARLVRRAA